MAAGRELRRAPILICGLLGLILVILIGTVITIRVTGDAATGRSSTDPTPSSGPTSTISPASSNSPSSSPGPSGGDALSGCPDGDPSWTRKHADDDRVHGGDLSFRPVRGAGFGQPKVVSEFSWWYDAHGQTARPGNGRTAVVAVGAVAIKPGVYTPAEAARSSMLCLISTNRFSRYTERNDVRSRKVIIDDQSGWELITAVHQPGKRSDGMRITVITIDAGPPGSISIFVGVAPIGDRARTKIISKVAADLRSGG